MSRKEAIKMLSDFINSYAQDNEEMEIMHEALCVLEAEK